MRPVTTYVSQIRKSYNKVIEGEFGEHEFNPYQSMYS
jgi:hypothetical protein